MGGRGSDGDPIKEIAKRTGFSQATVSRLLNGDPTLSVREETRRAIIRASEDLGYSAPGQAYRHSARSSLVGQRGVRRNAA